MLVIIKKDDATSVSREVADMAEARALAAGGMPVFVQNDDGSTTQVTAEDEPERTLEDLQADIKAGIEASAFGDMPPLDELVVG